MRDSLHRHADRFGGVSVVLMTGSLAMTIAGCLSMSAMGGVPMPGGWTLSAAWVPMCGQTWAGAAASFIGMWTVMMVAMMLPSLLPTLGLYRQALRCAGVRTADSLVGWIGAGYFVVWSMLGAIVFMLGAAMAQAALRMPDLARAMPVSWGVVVLLAGAVQLSAWKAHHLAGVAAPTALCMTLHMDAQAA